MSRRLLSIKGSDTHLNDSWLEASRLFEKVNEGDEDAKRKLKEMEEGKVIWYKPD